MLPLLLAVLTGPPVELAPPPRPAEPKRCGRIIVEGNVRTPDAAIFKLLPIFPGQVLPSAAEFAVIERKMLVKFAKQFDLAAGHWPTVRPLPTDPDSAFQDVEVRFPERALPPLPRQPKPERASPQRLRLPPPELPPAVPTRPADPVRR